MFKRYRQLESKEQIVVAVDTCAGGTDYTAGQFLSRTKMDVPIVLHTRETTTSVLVPLVQKLEEIYDTTQIKPVIALERQNGGTFLMDQIAAMNRNYKFELFKMPNVGRVDAPEAIRFGWDTTSASRPTMLQDLKQAIDNHLIKLYDKETVAELFSFIVVQTSSSWKAQAEVGAHDDLVMSLAIAYQLHQLVQTVDFGKIDVSGFPDQEIFKDGWY